MTFNFVLPSNCTAASIFPVVEREYLPLISTSVPERVVIDFSKMNFIKPCGVVFIDNFMKHLQSQGVEVLVKNHKLNTNALKFLFGAGFFDRWVPNTNKACRKNTTLPLVNIEPNYSNSWINSNLGPWLANCYNINDINQISELLASIQELFNNVADHSGVTSGSVFGQWYPNNQTIELCMADFGVGIPKTIETINTIDGVLSDARAIEMAFEEEITSQSTPRNRGVGLYFLKQNIVERFHGSIDAHSLSGGVTIVWTGNSPQFVVKEGSGFCPGTLFKLTLDSGFMPSDIDSDEDELWSF